MNCIECEWHKSLPVKEKSTKIPKLLKIIKNAKNTQNYDEHLMYKLFVII